MAGKKILVTGGTGYIGSHTVVELISSGYEPVIADNLSNSNSGIIRQIEKITGRTPEFLNVDLCDEKNVKNLVELHPDISGIIHFAAFKSVGESVSEPLKYYRNNIYSLIGLLETFAGKKIDFVFSSSCTVYGEPDNLPVNEQARIKDAESPYGNTKQISEEILRDFSSVNNNLNATALRYFNPVGAHSSALIGELPIGVPQNLVPFITQSAIGKRGKIVVFGDDYNTPDGSCIRDYIHVVDLAKAHIAALKNMEAKAAGGSFDVFNIGTGQGHTVLEVIKSFEQVTGVKLNYEIGPRRSGDIEKIYGDVTKAEKELAWKAGLGLNEMMSSAWAWENYIKQNPFE
ncbi:MAG: UDP-glucose 4-epimerase GalE [Daejeonella sp.]|uniref:UDP-glucose 4-epimerase GalE n=1 Tax=Daejeonella sp. JGW-45 TaxID=3034148 RepID=UPI0023ECC8E7|nr:UDP-glucose 4-epimerase GalE [Daejeonella sp. JGW-45]